MKQKYTVMLWHKGTAAMVKTEARNLGSAVRNAIVELGRQVTLDDETQVLCVIEGWPKVYNGPEAAAAAK